MCSIVELNSFLPDSALDSYASDVEDYAIEDDWFEGLLDWSAEQSLPVFSTENQPKLQQILQ